MDPVLSDFGAGVAALLAGQQPALVPFVGLIPWILRALRKPQASRPALGDSERVR
jgi:hypothetical protein